MNSTPRIIFFSRDGHSEALAGVLSEELDGELSRVNTDRYKWPLWGWVRAAVDSLRERAPRLTGEPSYADEPGLIVLVGPVWVGRLAAPLNTVLDHLKPTDLRVALALTCGDPKEQTEPLQYAERRLCRSLAASTVVSSANEDWLIDSIKRRKFVLECRAGLEWQG
ncbi:MAG: hypothetical protein AAGB10_21465 [Pseudomonadota bacterium]